jgi:single-strand DNA-binding protein
MAGEPTVTLVGNLTADPELRYVSSGTPVCSFTLASTPRRQNQATQQWEDGETMFVRCDVWKQMGENVAESLAKGNRVVATGRLSVRSYEHEGQQRTSINLTVDEIGPSLRYATATPTKTNSGQSMSQQSSSPGGGYGTPNSQAEYDPWASRGGHDAPPF